MILCTIEINRFNPSQDRRSAVSFRDIILVCFTNGDHVHPLCSGAIRTARQGKWRLNVGPTSQTVDQH